MQYKFKAFGLNIISEFPFRALNADEKGISDIIVKSSSISDTLDSSNYNGINIECNQTEFLLKVPGVANFLIRNGNEVLIDAESEAELREIELFFMGSVLSVILMQRDIIPFHGSAFAKDDKAIIITGKSGAGKSSLLRYFITQGYKAITDDVCALSVINNKVMLRPSYPSSKIWSDVMDEFDLTKKEEHQIRPEIEKYAVSLTENFANKNLEVDSIYILNIKNNTKFETDEIRGFGKFSELKRNLYRPKFPEAMGKEKETFVLLNQLAQQIRLFTISRSNSIKYLDAFNRFAKENIIK